MLNLEKLQTPTGTYSVGFQHTSLIHENRNVDGKNFRDLPIMTWYSASSFEGCEVKHYQRREALPARMGGKA